MARPRTAWILIAASAALGACAQILGLQPWIPGDGGIGGGGAGGSSATSSTSASSSSGGDAGLCSSTNASCQACEGCADLTGGPCAAAYTACAAATAAGECANVLSCIGVCGGDSTCIGVCPGQETTPTKLFPAYAACLCQACAPSCTSFAAALCH